MLEAFIAIAANEVFPPSQTSAGVCVQSPQRAWSCYCKEPHTLGVVHRTEAPCYIPNQCGWVGLTDEELKDIWLDYDTDINALKTVEAKLKEKNHG